MYIAILFCIGDVDAALNTQYSYPFIEILLLATDSRVGTAVIVGFMSFINLGIVIVVLTASSRMLWSFARDRGVPGWRMISKVRPISCFAY